MKALIRSLVRRAGFDLRRLPQVDADAYCDWYPSESIRERRFYNVGAGSFWHPCWTSIDFASDYYGAVQKNILHHDLMALTRLPIPDNHAEVIYSSHTVEHVSDEAVEYLVRDAFRCLKPGGVLRITTGGDAELDYAAYRKGDRSYFYWTDWHSAPGTWETIYTIPLRQASLHQVYLNDFASQLAEISCDRSAPHRFSDSEIADVFSQLPFADALNYFTTRCRFNPEFPGSHISWWTHDKLLGLMRGAGFSQAYRSGYGQSCAPPLRNIGFFDNTHPKISLYCEAVK